MRTVDRIGRITDDDDRLVLTTLPAPDVPATVRSLLEIRLPQWSVGSGELADAILLCASELVTNACAATPVTPITCSAVLADGQITFSAWDASDDLPAAATVSELEPDDIAPDAMALDPGYDDGTGGWGLPLVAASCAAYGVSRTEPRGKWVWARFDLRAHNA